MGRPSAWRWMRPARPKRRTSRSRSSTCAACPLSTCPPSWRRCRRLIARSWFTRRRSSVGLVVKSPPGSATTASTCWRRRWPASEEWMHRIRRRATRSSTCRMSIGFSKPSTSPSPMADQTFRLPDLGEGLTEAQLVTWRVQEGGHVEVNEPLCDVETAKAVVVIPSPWMGTIQKLHARPGESVAVGSALVTIAAEGAPAAVEPRPAEGVEATPTDGERRISVVGIRKAIARQMVRSVSTIPQFTEFAVFDATNLLAARQRQKQSGRSLTPLPYFIVALVKAVRAFPLMNSSWDEARDEIVVKQPINLGIAVNTSQGLLVPVLRGADQLDLSAIADQSARLIEGARAGTLKPGEMSGGTITITNVGASGPVETGTPIISPPECCVVAFGANKPRPMVIDGEVVARSGAWISISVDHRIVDGALATEFLTALVGELEHLHA